MAAAMIGDALRQAFMPKRDYESLRDDDRPSSRPIAAAVAVVVVSGTVVASSAVALNVVFPSDASRRPFCAADPAPALRIGERGGDHYPGAFYLTDQETVDYFWFVVFVPSLVLFLVSAVYLIAGITVSFSAPTRHRCLNVVESNCCASKRGGVRCLSILNAIFAIIFAILALFLGSNLLTLGNTCSVPLFWCYEFASWGLVILYGGTACSLRRRAATILDEGESGSRTRGVEMLEARPVDITPEVERRVSEGFKAWMGSSLLSSDEEDEGVEEESHSYHEAPNSTRTIL